MRKMTKKYKAAFEYIEKGYNGYLAGLSPNDFRVFEEILNSLYSGEKSKKTIVEQSAMLFKKLGFKVVKSGINYVIYG